MFLGLHLWKTYIKRNPHLGNLLQENISLNPSSNVDILPVSESGTKFQLDLFWCRDLKISVDSWQIHYLYLKYVVVTMPSMTLSSCLKKKNDNQLVAYCMVTNPWIPVIAVNCLATVQHMCEIPKHFQQLIFQVLLKWDTWYHLFPFILMLLP